MVLDRDRNIQPLRWLPAREILGGEASDFTPWLAANLDLLAEALGLTDLTLEGTEQSVQGKSLDILARGVDQDDNEVVVAIENQYGVTDHRHLGQLITYLAQYGHGYAVWVVEEVHPAHAAAVDFLNRTSPEDVNYFLAQVRFTHGADGGHQVFFELAAKPNIFSKQPGGSSRSASRPANEPRKDYLAHVLALCEQELRAAGYPRPRMHVRGSYIETRVPIPALEDAGAEFKIYVTQNETAARLHIYGFDDREHSSAALDVLRDRYEAAWEAALPDVGDHEWHAGNAGARSDSVKVTLSGQGYHGGDAAVSARWAARVGAAWLAVMKNDPIEDLAGEVEERLRSGNEDL